MNFELERHKVLKTVHDGIGDPKDDVYIDIRDNLQRLDNVANRNTITTNLMNCITYKEDKNKPYYEDRYESNNLKRLQDDLDFITKNNPVKCYVDENPRKDDAPRYAVSAWADLMTQSGSEERHKLKNKLTTIRYGKSQEEQDHIYDNAAHWFGLIDKSDMSVKRQSSLLLSCLSNPDKDANWHLANMDRRTGSVADLDLNKDLAFQIDGDADRNSFCSDEQQEIKADVNDDNGADGFYDTDEFDDPEY